MSDFCDVVAITMSRSLKRAFTVSSPSWHTSTHLHSLTINSPSSVIHFSFLFQPGTCLNILQRTTVWVFSFHLTRGFTSQAKLQCVEAFMATNKQMLRAKLWCCSHHARDKKIGWCFYFSSLLVLQTFQSVPSIM